MVMLISYTMGAIKRQYPTKFYHWPIEKEKKQESMMKWKSDAKQPFILFHPYLNFDPIKNFDRQISMMDRDHTKLEWEMKELYDFLEKIYVSSEDRLMPIVHETIRTDFGFFDNLESLLTKIEFNFKLFEGEWLWGDTGYWIAKDKKFRYLGLSEASALNLWRDSEDLILCYVASNPSTLLEFTLDKRAEDSFSLNIYYANRYVVFPDLIDAIHKALNALGSWKTIRVERGDHDDIFGKNHSEYSMAGSGTPATFNVNPKRVIPLSEDPPVGTDWLYAVVVENTFFSIDGAMDVPEGFAILIRSGGFLRDDFQAKKKHYLSFSKVRRLENCFLVELVANGFKEEDSILDTLLKR